MTYLTRNVIGPGKYNLRDRVAGVVQKVKLIESLGHQMNKDNLDDAKRVIVWELRRLYQFAWQLHRDLELLDRGAGPLTLAQDQEEDSP